MARDIIIYGIDQDLMLERIRSRWAVWQMPDPQQAYWLEAMSGPSITALQDLEKLFWEEKDWSNDQLHEALGFVELVSYRSRANILPLLELIQYFNNYFSWEEREETRFEMSDGSTLLDFEQMDQLLHWLCAASAAFVPELDTKKEDWVLDPEYVESARLMRQQPGFHEKEFSNFGDPFYLIRGWQQTIRAAKGVDLFYLENSY